MAKPSEEISKYNANSAGKPDSNLSNDSNHLGGIPANEFATQGYVQNYHNSKEALQKEYIDSQDGKILQQAKAYTDQVVENQDFSDFAKFSDVQALDTKLSNKITEANNTQKAYTDTEIQKVVSDTNSNFNDVENAINTLNQGQNDLFQSVSNGKSKIAEAITDKGVSTSATDTFGTMAGNIRNIQSGIPEGYINTSDATANASDMKIGKTAYAQGQKLYGTLDLGAGTDTSDATATPFDILQGKTAYVNGQKIEGTLTISSGETASQDLSGVTKIYGDVDYYIDEKILPNALETNTSAKDELLIDKVTGKILGKVVSYWETIDSTRYYGLYTYIYDKTYGFVNKTFIKYSDLGLPNNFLSIYVSDFSNTDKSYVALKSGTDLYVLKIELEKEQQSDGSFLYYYTANTEKIYHSTLTISSISFVVFNDANTEKILVGQYRDINYNAQLQSVSLSEQKESDTNFYKITFINEYYIGQSFYAPSEYESYPIYSANTNVFSYWRNPKILVLDGHDEGIVVFDDNFNILRCTTFSGSNKIALSNDCSKAISYTTGDIYNVSVLYSTGEIILDLAITLEGERRLYTSSTSNCLRLISQGRKCYVSIRALLRK